MSRTITHVVLTNNFAGVERYVTTVAAATAARGWTVRVLGGREEEMRSLLPSSVEWRPAMRVSTAVRELSTRSTDVVHAHMTKAEVAAALTPRRPRIVATRHFASTRGRNRYVASGANLLARRLHAEVAISETVRSASGTPGMRVLLNAVPIRQIPREPEHTVVVAQRWDVEKRTADAIDAFERSGLASENWRLVVHGAGSEEAELRRRASDSSASAAIEIAGFARNMDDVLARAGIVLATAEREPFGLVVAEAMAAGVPVVASRSGGHLETVGQVAAQWLYPAGDVSAGADLLRALGRTSPDERASYGEDLRRWATDHLGVESHVDELLDIYEGRRWLGTSSAIPVQTTERPPRIR